jgi:NAD(P)-dependent dehydrogenase (short-subunit alcohol dehydrogenase family)
MRGVKGKNRSVAQDLEQAGATVVEIDVTDDQSVEQGVDAAIGVMNGLDVVINNAGVGALGVQEAFSTEQWQQLFDVNVFGTNRVTRAALPHLREQGSGHLVFVSSLLGRITIPFYGPYNASKWALESMAENYRTELSRYGIDVSMVEPGGFPTTFIDNLVQAGDEVRKQQLGAFAGEPLSFLQGFEQALAANPAQDPNLVAQAITRVIDTPLGERPFRTIVDNMGMGDAIRGYNEQLAQVTSGIYGAFGIDNMLSVTH